MKLFIMVLLAILASSTTHAAEDLWVKNCELDATFDLVAATGAGVVSLQPGEFACAESLTATNVTANVSIMDCLHVDITQFIDADGDADDSTVTGLVQICPNAEDDDQSCDEFAYTALTATEQEKNVQGQYVRIKSGGTSDTAPVRWVLFCHGNTH
jgi:hypothetical protein